MKAQGILLGFVLVSVAATGVASRAAFGACEFAQMNTPESAQKVPVLQIVHAKELCPETGATGRQCVGLKKCTEGTTVTYEWVSAAVRESGKCPPLAQFKKAETVAPR